MFDEYSNEDLHDIEIRRKGIEDAIDELKESSSAGPDGIPVIFLKKTKDVISLPLAIILRKSLDSGEIPDIFKMACITPIHKGRERKSSERYRPVSLTSHIMKIFERVCFWKEHPNTAT